MSPVCVAHTKISEHTVQLVGDGVRGAAIVSVKERTRNTLYHLRDTKGRTKEPEVKVCTVFR